MRGLLGSFSVLLPRPDAVRACRLMPDPWPAPIVFRSADGEPRLVFRSWRARPRKSGSDGTAYLLAGSDLIVHPDTMQQLVENSEYALSTGVYSEGGTP